MKLIVKNFGPIREAKVDIKPMTIFIGPSNTGKSYLAILVYIFDKVLNELFSFLDFTNFNATIDVKNIADEEKITNIVNAVLSECTTTIHERWETEAIRCFGEEWQNLTKQNGAPASIVVSNESKGVVLDFISPEKDKFPPLDSITKKIKEEVIGSLNLHENKNFIYVFEGPGDLGKMYSLDLTALVLPEVSGLLSFLPDMSRSDKPRHYPGHRYITGGINTHYLPAVRGGLMQSHRIMVTALVDRAPTTGLTGTEFIPFTGVLADFVRKLFNIDERRHHTKRTNNISALSQEIEQRIMRGAIHIKTLETRYPDFRYNLTNRNSNPREISLMYASSSVSELASIVLFIRYYISPGDVFIVEEPEAHLHPEAQRIVAGVLVELVKAGVYVIATTHSDIILEQISNFIHADKVPGARVLSRKAEQRTLPRNKVGAYVFRASQNGKGTTVRVIRFNKQTGILTKDHLDVSSDLYNEAVDLFNIREKTSDTDKSNDA